MRAFATTIFAKLRAWCLHSATIAWSYCLGIFGALAIVIDEAADLSGDPVLRDEISVAIGDPRTTGRVLLAISLVTIIARLRTLWRRS